MTCRVFVRKRASSIEAMFDAVFAFCRTGSWTMESCNMRSDRDAATKMVGYRKRENKQQQRSASLPAGSVPGADCFIAARKNFPTSSLRRLFRFIRASNPALGNQAQLLLDSDRQLTASALLRKQCGSLVACCFATMTVSNFAFFWHATVQV